MSETVRWKQRASVSKAWHMAKPKKCSSYLTDDSTLKTRSTSYVIETDRKVEGLVKRRCRLSFWISPALPVSTHCALRPICRSLGMPWHARVPQWCRCSVLTISNPLVRFTTGLGDHLLWVFRQCLCYFWVAFGCFCARQCPGFICLAG